MKIGIGLPNQVRGVDPRIIPEWSARAESAGFSTLATVGRTAYPGMADTVVLAGAAAATRTIGLSSTIMLTTVWPPVLLAKELAGIDGMSGGRLTLGVGIGGNRPDDFVVDGLPPEGLGGRMDRDLETYHGVWRGEPVGGGVNAAVPAATRPIPLLFGGLAPVAFRRMATWGQGYIAGSLPAPAVVPFFDLARQAWKEQGREDAPKLVAIAYFAFGDAARGRDNIRDYYAAVGAEYADAVANAVHVGADEVREAVRSFAAIGADELILHPALADLDEIGRLADAVL
ncbi:LLM class flavin-dependent oxidoreductase [Streptomyces liangshanensis]|uniref:LLM class flavin-dependent oxidoreductase n=1 Tax=Streptomyces liangshanensis TaxID=2717324 RepID=A0A6G9H602_9ACTN|nr:LLM class flavin-dependent oxidoreductase [Streptomyces liangshanensis]QIQ05874.1 LLM class flavin-dependent oxidoreductase [Streptomyces liangshanensis]